MAVSQFNALLAQDATQHPHAITYHTAAGDNGKHVGLRTDAQLRYHIAQSGWQIEIVGRKDQTDALFVRQIYACCFYQRH